LDAVSGYTIRPETPADTAAVHDLLVATFPTPAEAGLVSTLRTLHVTHWVSLVAEHAGKIVGHILFTPVGVRSSPDWHALGLAPMAVHPAHQRKGVGSMLVRAGFDACRALGENVVFVLGHPEFYPRFGFQQTKPLGITCEFDVPANVYMVAELKPGVLAGRKGVVHYHDAFKGV